MFISDSCSYCNDYWGVEGKEERPLPGDGGGGLRAIRLGGRDEEVWRCGLAPDYRYFVLIFSDLAWWWPLRDIFFFFCCLEFAFENFSYLSCLEFVLWWMFEAWCLNAIVEKFILWLASLLLLLLPLYAFLLALLLIMVDGILAGRVCFGNGLRTSFAGLASTWFLILF